MPLNYWKGQKAFFFSGAFLVYNRRSGWILPSAVLAVTADGHNLYIWYVHI